MVEYCYSYLLPVKYEPFSHVIPILILLEEFTAWKRRQRYGTLLALPVLLNSSLATFDSRCWRTQEPWAHQAFCPVALGRLRLTESSWAPPFPAIQGPNCPCTICVPWSLQAPPSLQVPLSYKFLVPITADKGSAHSKSSLSCRS